LAGTRKEKKRKKRGRSPFFGKRQSGEEKGIVPFTKELALGAARSKGGKKGGRNDALARVEGKRDRQCIFHKKKNRRETEIQGRNASGFSRTRKEEVARADPRDYLVPPWTKKVKKKTTGT